MQSYVEKIEKHQKIMKVLIDCGASDGQAIEQVVNLYGTFDRVIAIEANPELIPKLQSLPNTEVVHAIVSDKMSIETLYFGEHFTESSTFLEKTTGNLSSHRSVEVTSIDFGQWLSDNLNGTEDLVVCKMDIEGSEFKVLKKIIQDKSIKLIHILHIEWHANRFRNKWKLRLDRAYIKTWLYLNSIKCKDWH